MKIKNLNLKNKTMKAAIFYGPRQVRLEEIRIPDIGPDEVLLKIKSALTCGTDRKMYLRGIIYLNRLLSLGMSLLVI